MISKFEKICGCVFKNIFKCINDSLPLFLYFQQETCLLRTKLIRYCKSSSLKYNLACFSFHSVGLCKNKLCSCTLHRIKSAIRIFRLSNTLSDIILLKKVFSILAISDESLKTFVCFSLYYMQLSFCLNRSRVCPYESAGHPLQYLLKRQSEHFP